MSIQLSGPEQRAASSKILRAIRNRFPGADDAKTLHAAWPHPKPVPAVLYMLLTQPVNLLTGESHKELLLALPGVLSQSGEDLVDILGEPLGRYYAQLQLDALDTGAQTLIDSPQPDMPPSSPDMARLIKQAAMELLGQLPGEFIDKIADAVVDRLQTRGLVIAANQEDALPINKYNKALTAEEFAEWKEKWGSLLLADSPFLQKNTPELLEGLSKAGILTQKDLADILVTKLHFVSWDHKRAAAFHRVRSLLTGDIFQNRTVKQRQGRPTLDYEMHSIAEFADLSPRAAFGRLIPYKRAARVSTPAGTPKSRSGLKNMPPHVQGRAYWFRTYISNTEFLKTGAPKLLSALEEKAEIHTYKDLSDALMLKLEVGKARAGQIIRALQSGDIFAPSSKGGLKLRSGIGAVADIAGIPAEEAFAPAISEEVQKRSSAAATQDLPIEQKTGTADTNLIRTDVVEQSSRIRKDWSLTLLKDSKFLQDCAPELLDALEKAGIRSWADLSDQLMPKLNVTRSRTGQIIHMLISGDVFSRHSSDLKSSLNTIAAMAGLDSTVAFGRAIQNKKDELAASPKSVSAKQASAPAAPRVRAAAAPARDKLKARKSREDWSAILLANSAFLRDQAPELLAKLDGLNIKSKADLVGALILRTGSHKAGIGRTIDVLIAGDVVDRHRSKNEIIVKQNMVLIADIAGIPADQAYAQAIQSYQKSPTTAVSPSRQRVESQPTASASAASPSAPSPVAASTMAVGGQQKSKPPHQVPPPSSVVRRGGLKHLASGSFVLHREITPPAEALPVSTSAQVQKVTAPTDLDLLWTELKAAHPVLAQELGSQNIEDLYGRVLARVGNNYDRNRFYIQLQDLAQGALDQETRKLKPIAKLIHLALGYSEDISTLFLEAAEPLKVKTDKPPRTSLRSAAAEVVSDSKRQSWSAILLTGSDFLTNDAAALLAALEALNLRTKQDLVTAITDKTGTGRINAGRLVDSLLAGDVINLHVLRDVEIKDGAKTITGIAKVSAEDVFKKTIDIEREKRATAVAHAASVKVTPKPPSMRAAKEKGVAPTSDNPVAQSFITLGMDKFDAETLADMGVDTREQLIVTLSDPETVEILGLSTDPNIIQKIITAATGYDHSIESTAITTDEDSDLEPLRPDERMLGPDSDLREWKHSGLDKTQLDCLRDEDVVTVGDMADLSYDALSDALGEASLNPAFATKIILRAKLICQKIAAGEYASMRKGWLSSIQADQLRLS